jgi:peroxiredoxin
MPLSIGSKAPDFTLKSASAAGLVDITLSARYAERPVVLLFFPLAFTGTCTTEMCDVSQGIGAYGELGADVLGISVDSPFAQAAWAAKEKITIPLISDLNKTAAKAFDVVFPGLAGIGDTSARAAFVIDKTGTIRYSEQTATPKDLPNFDAIKAALGEIK